MRRIAIPQIDSPLTDPGSVPSLTKRQSRLILFRMRRSQSARIWPQNVILQVRQVMPASRHLALRQSLKSWLARFGQMLAKTFIIALIVVSMGGWLYLLTKAAIWIIHVV